MPRKSDTYVRALELAARWSAEGRPLEQTAIRREIGYGSYSTISRALQDWRTQTRSGEAPPETSGYNSAEPRTPTIDRELQDSLQQIQRALAALRPSQTDPTTNFAAVAERLDALAQRFDGTQRHMLLQIEEARAHAAKWKEKWETAQGESRTWREALQAQQASVARLREELAWLRGTAGKPLPAGGAGAPHAVPAAPSTPSPAPFRYPGHPRPVPQHFDDDANE